MSQYGHVCPDVSVCVLMSVCVCVCVCVCVHVFVGACAYVASDAHARSVGRERKCCVVAMVGNDTASSPMYNHSEIFSSVNIGEQLLSEQSQTL